MSAANPPRSDLAALVAVALIALAPLLVVCLAGVLGGLLAHGRPLVIGPQESARVAVRLARRFTTPQLAWPAAQRARLPGALELQVLLGVERRRV